MQIALVALGCLLLVGIFWVRSGLNLYPINDGWAVYHHSKYYADFSFERLVLQSNRNLRLLHYVIAHEWGPSGFHLLNLQLILIDAGILLGLFVLTRNLFGGHGVAAFLVACLAMFFPNDPTMFWLGAFGVNLSCLLMLWASNIAIAGIPRKSLLASLASALLIYAGARTYPGFVMLPPLVVGSYLLRERGIAGALKDAPRVVIPQAVALLAAVAPLLGAILDGRGYESNRADLEPLLVARGYWSMLGHVTWRWMDDVWAFSPWMWPYLGAILLLVCAVAWWLWKRDAEAAKTRAAMAGAGLDNLPLFVVACAVLMVACYLPYSLTDIRFANDRGLIGSRYAFLLLLGGLAVRWTSGIGPHRGARIAKSSLAFAGIALLALFCINKLDLFEKRRRIALMQEVFLSDFAKLLPCPDAAQGIVLLPKGNSLNPVRGNAMMMVRPVYPLQVVYDVKRMRVLAFREPQLGRAITTNRQSGSLMLRKTRQTIDLSKPVLLVRYDLEQGARLAPQVDVVVSGGKGGTLPIRSAPLPPANCKPAPMIRELQGRRERILREAGLSRP
jgi:hypothetical protein